MNSGIYKIHNLVNNKVYIGKSSDLHNRFHEHKLALLGNRHKNLHLQKAWDKVGVENFSFDTIEECEVALLNEKEIYWITKFNSTDKRFGYNKTHGGDGGRLNDEAMARMAASNRGKKCSKETKLKLSLINKGRKLGANNGMFGKKPWNKGLTKTDNKNLLEIGNLVAKYWQSHIHPSLGKPMPKKTREKISKSKTGEIKSAEHKKKISEALKGRKLSSETKIKMSKSRKGKKQKMLTCPHCNKFGGTTMYRWHFDNCKYKYE